MGDLRRGGEYKKNLEKENYLAFLGRHIDFSDLIDTFQCMVEEEGEVL